MQILLKDPKNTCQEMYKEGKKRLLRSVVCVEKRVFFLEKNRNREIPASGNCRVTEKSNYRDGLAEKKVKRQVGNAFVASRQSV